MLIVVYYRLDDLGQPCRPPQCPILALYHNATCVGIIPFFQIKTFFCKYKKKKLCKWESAFIPFSTFFLFWLSRRASLGGGGNCLHAWMFELQKYPLLTFDFWWWWWWWWYWKYPLLEQYQTMLNNSINVPFITLRNCNKQIGVW